MKGNIGAVVQSLTSIHPLIVVSCGWGSPLEEIVEVLISCVHLSSFTSFYSTVDHIGLMSRFILYNQFVLFRFCIIDYFDVKFVFSASY